MKPNHETSEIDFFFDPTQLTLQEQQMISDFIKSDKAKQKKMPVKSSQQKRRSFSKRINTTV